MVETNAATKNILLELISDFEDFIDRLEKRKADLEELKDELLIYSDPEFMESIEIGLRESEIGDTVRCDDLKAISELFDSV